MNECLHINNNATSGLARSRYSFINYTKTQERKGKERKGIWTEKGRTSADKEDHCPVFHVLFFSTGTGFSELT